MNIDLWVNPQPFMTEAKYDPAYWQYWEHGYLKIKYKALKLSNKNTLLL